MSAVYVVDAGVLFSTWMKKHPEDLFFTTSGIREEVLNKPSKFRIDTLEFLNRLHEESATSESLRVVTSAATETGDITSLSKNDIELIAVAHSKSLENMNIALVSTDMAILNTARRMGIKTIDPSGKFKDDIRWILRCPACDYRSDKPMSGLECPICGTRMYRKALKRRKKQ